MSVGAKDKNQLRPILKREIPHLLHYDKTLATKTGTMAVQRAGISKLRVPEDVLTTPPGQRMIKYKTKLRGELSTYVKTHYEGQVYDILMQFLADERYLYPRSLHAIDDCVVQIPWLSQDINMKGISSHVLSYSRSIPSPENVMMSQLKDKITEAVRKFPMPPAYGAMVDKSEWHSKIRTGTNCGYPYWKTTDTELRAELVDAHKHILTQMDIPAKVYFTLFYRTQPSKSRAVCGGDTQLKVVGGFTTHVLTSLIGPSEGIAWGDYGVIFDTLLGHYNNSSTVISLDFSKLDTTINRDMHHAALDAVGTLWGTKDSSWRHFFEMYKTMVTTNAWLYTHPGYALKVEDGLLSGEPLTQFTDSIIVMAVTLLLADVCGWELNGYLTLGDDVIMFIDDEWNSENMQKFNDFTKLLEQETGLVVNVEKSFPGDISSGGIGIFLQYFITDKGVYGHPLRKPHSMGFLERDSSMIKGIDFHKFARAEGAKLAYLVRSVQVTASATENIPGVEDYVGIMQKYDRLLQDPGMVERALYLGDKYQRETGGEVATINIHPRWVIPHL